MKIYRLNDYQIIEPVSGRSTTMKKTLKRILTDGIFSTVTLITAAFITLIANRIFDTHLELSSRFAMNLISLKLSRIAVPILVFALAEIMRRSEKKISIVIAAYLSGIAYGVAYVLYCAVSKVEILFWEDNIFGIFFWTSLFIYIISRVSCAMKAKDKKSVLTYMLVLITALIISVATAVFYIEPDIIVIPDSISIIIKNAARVLFMSPLVSRRGVGMVIMGVLFYLVRDRKYQCLVYLAFCAFSLVGALYGVNGYWHDSYQYYMILALPLIFLYRKEHA